MKLKKPQQTIISFVISLVIAVLLFSFFTGGSGRGVGDGVGTGVGSGEGTGRGTGKGAGVGDHVGDGSGTGEGDGSGDSEEAEEDAESGEEQTEESDAPPSEKTEEKDPETKNKDVGLEIDLSSLGTKDWDPSMINIGKKKATGGSGKKGRSGRGGGGGRGKKLGTGDVSFRMYWKPRRHDIDLHVVDPNGHHLWYSIRNCDCNGILDRDDQTSGGPENIYWPKGKGPRGKYTFWGHYFNGTGPKTVTIEVRRDKKVIKKYKHVLRRRTDMTPHYTFELPAN